MSLPDPIEFARKRAVDLEQDIRRYSAADRLVFWQTLSGHVAESMAFARRAKVAARTARMQGK